MTNDVVVLKDEEKPDVMRDLIVRTTRGDLLYWAAIKREDLDKLIARGFEVVQKGTYDEYINLKKAKE